MAIPAYKTDTHPVSYRVNRRVRVREQDLKTAEEITATHNTSSVVARILAARGFTPGEELRQYLNPTLKDGMPEPETLKNLTEAAQMIRAVHDVGGSIAICCDFDVDGLSGGSVAHAFLNDVGVSSKVFVPDRFVDGYGLNENTVREIAAAGFALLLTIDFGTTNVKELTVAKELGLKTIVVDHHHTAGKVPPADVFINPHQDGCGFAKKIPCAAGLAWYLVVGLRREFPEKKVDARSYLDLACLGTICDMVPLIGVNRVIAKRGLELLSTTERPGLRSMRNAVGVRGMVGCSDVSFGIGPRLNAAGRIEHGEVVVELLSTNDSNRADKIAKRLNELNAERQTVEAQVKDAALKIVENSGGPRSGIVVWNKEFHTGVIGIVAQRMVEAYYRPSIVMGMDSEGIYKGSVRGIKGFSVVDALASISNLLIKFGGHEGAGGFSIKEENLETLREAFNTECEKRLKDIETVPYADADTEATLSEITVPLVEELKNLAPFGMGNPNPSVLLRNMRVVDVRDIKGAHLKVLLSDGSKYIAGLMWRQPSHPALELNKRVDVVIRPEVSNFNGTVELQGNIQAVEEVGVGAQGPLQIAL